MPAPTKYAAGAGGGLILGQCTRYNVLDTLGTLYAYRLRSIGYAILKLNNSLQFAYLRHATLNSNKSNYNTKISKFITYDTICNTNVIVDVIIPDLYQMNRKKFMI
jgi:hypothetical protein